jgi:hypothetical protein
MGYNGFFLGVKRPGRETVYSPPSSADVRMRGAVPTLPNAPLWCDAHLKKAKGQLYFYLLGFMTNYNLIKQEGGLIYCCYKIMYVYMYVCTVISLKAGWILIQCRHQMLIHTPMHMHMQAHTHVHTLMHSTPHTTTARRIKPVIKLTS